MGTTGRTLAIGVAAIAVSTGAEANQTHFARVRAEDPAIAAVIAQGVERSTTFRRLIDDLDTTDGLVYVLQGTCGQGVRACLHMSVELSGSHRLLRILVNPRRAPGCELAGSIGHELQHAREALSNPRIKSGAGLSSFFHQIGPEGPRRFETPEAEQVGVQVAREACKGWMNR